MVRARGDAAVCASNAELARVLPSPEQRAGPGAARRLQRGRKRVAGGADAIPTVGPMIGDILGAMGAVYTAMAVTMIVMGVINRVKP